VRQPQAVKITPVDIQHKQFKRGLQGYAREDVDAYLDEIIESMEEDIEERTRLASEINDLRDKVSHFKAMEASLQSTLVLAQRTADELKANAHKEVDLAKQRATLELDNELAAVRRQIQEAKEELQRARDHVNMVKHDLRNFLSRHLALIDEERPGSSAAS
jgi:cell division initiation protein